MKAPSYVYTLMGIELSRQLSQKHTKERNIKENLGLKHIGKERKLNAPLEICFAAMKIKFIIRDQI